ncbi:MAG: FAD:protein FMN transferase [Melioribacteraceae bacterium]|nr:FAD:protein FMN transferase [Melioribacteraceae bacterium]
MKKYFFYISILVGFLSCNNDETIKRTTIIMGSTVEIQIRGVNSVTANKAIFASFEEVKRLDTLFSTYMTGNPMWMLNNTDADEIVVTNEMFNMLKMCDEIWRMTNGAFDPAIGNLIHVIGFEKGSPKLPTNEEIKNALGKIGWKNIFLKEENIIVKPKQVKLSFNAIVPGYAADKVANLLSNFGIKEYLINVGGEIFARGDNWRIGIQHPRKENELLGAINVNGMGVSTSGDYEQYFKKDGKRYSHLLNPLTGYPADECEAVTIIAKEASLADALSTGIFILGPVKGMELIEKLENIEGMIVDTTGTIHESSGFKKFLVRK